jgi:hypothetical protein
LISPLPAINIGIFDRVSDLVNVSHVVNSRTKLAFHIA